MTNLQGGCSYQRRTWLTDKRSVECLFSKIIPASVTVSATFRPLTCVMNVRWMTWQFPVHSVMKDVADTGALCGG